MAALTVVDDRVGRRAREAMSVAVAVVLAVFSCGDTGGSGDPPAVAPEDGDGTDMVYVDGGAFMMGCDAAVIKEGCSPDAPRHEVSIDGFYIGKYEVTQRLWVAVMGENPAYYSGVLYDDPMRPVEQVSWGDVMGFIAKLNKATGKRYRLPTEAEWEYAARGGVDGGDFEFSGGNDVDAVAWHKGNGSGFTHPVGGKLPNALGLYDMSGNVAEWVADWYDDQYYSVSPTDNPKGPASAEYRVHRGGTWQYSSVACRVFRRDFAPPESKENYLGFRLAHP